MPTILIADDNADLRQLMKLQLEKHGFACLGVADGKDVLETLKATPIDLVLMDLNMPELDGWETSAAIRASEQFSHLPIIALTAYSLEGDRARATTAGCDAFHCKPVELETLLKDIKLLLQSHSTLA